MPQVFALTQITFIDVIGPDSARFLQGQISINISSVNQDEALLSCCCNPKGRIVSLFHIVAINDGFRLFLPTSTASDALEHLKKYGVFYKVTITAQAKIDADTDSLLVADDLENKLHITTSVVMQIAKPQNDSELDWHTISNTKLIIAVNTAAITFPKGDKQWCWTLAEAKIPWLNKASVTQFLPHDLNLPALNAVDFNKGCFTGQEVIARMQYKGKLKQHMVLLSGTNLSNVEALNKLLQDDKTVGKIICSISNNENQWLSLALLKDSASHDKNIQLNIENSPILQLRN